MVPVNASVPVIFSKNSIMNIQVVLIFERLVRVGVADATGVRVSVEVEVDGTRTHVIGQSNNPGSLRMGPSAFIKIVHNRRTLRYATR